VDVADTIHSCDCEENELSCWCTKNSSISTHENDYHFIYLQSKAARMME